MPFQPFHEIFHNLAEAESRTITVFNAPNLPNDKYGLLESYCNDQNCDCRRVFLNIFSVKHEKVMAVIAFGWENEKFYADWMHVTDLKIAKQLQGPILNLASHQSKLAPELLKLVNEEVLQDKEYIERLKVHYKLFRDEVDKKPQINNTIALPPKVGRNMPCPCGSGKKYKKCCLQ